jgi:hypothetical protein
LCHSPLTALSTVLHDGVLQVTLCLGVASMATLTNALTEAPPLRLGRGSVRGLMTVSAALALVVCHAGMPVNNPTVIAPRAESQSAVDGAATPAWRHTDEYAYNVGGG